MPMLTRSDQHFIMDFLRAIQAYTSNMEVPFAAVFYYTIVRRDLDLIKSGCYIAVTIVSDALIVRTAISVPYFVLLIPVMQCYRTFVIWGHNYLFALIPFGLVLADVGTQLSMFLVLTLHPTLTTLTSALGVYAVFLLSQVVPGNDALLSTVTERVKYFYAVTLALNLLCTSKLALQHYHAELIIEQS